MQPLSSVNNGSDNSKQFSFTLILLSHCSVFVYFSDVFTFFLCLFIFSIREYSCNMSQVYLRVQKKTIVLLSFIVFSPSETMFFFISHKKKLEIFRGLCLGPTGGLTAPPPPPDTQLMFYMPLAHSFFALQETNVPIFFLYYTVICLIEISIFVSIYATINCAINANINCACYNKLRHS